MSCSILDCKQKIHAKNLCGKHYMQHCRAGKTDSNYFKRTILDRIVRKIKEVNSIGCWKVDLYHNNGGYAKINVGKKSRRVHRVLFQILIEKVPLNMDLDHLCRNRWCQNPGHLEIVTRKENLNRGIRYNQ